MKTIYMRPNCLAENEIKSIVCVGWLDREPRNTITISDYLLNEEYRRDFSDAIKAIGKGNQKVIKESVACKVLIRIGTIYKLEGTLREFTSQERLKER